MNNDTSGVRCAHNLHESLYDKLSGSWSRLLDSVSWRVKYGALLGEALPLMSSRRWAVCATHLLASMHCGEKSTGDIDESVAAQTGSVDEVRDLCDEGEPAAGSGRLDVVRYLCELPADRSEHPAAHNNDAILTATDYGHLDVLV